MFGSDGDDESRSLSDVVDAVKAPLGRTQEGSCFRCGEDEGSMIELRKYDVVVCKECYNDPETYEELDDNPGNPYE